MKLYINVCLMLLVVLIVLSNRCYCEEVIPDYSKLLQKAIKASEVHGGYALYNVEVRSGIPDFKPIKEFRDKEAVPFFLDVIKNGPSWSVDEQDLSSLEFAHAARCYAVLSLAYTKDPQAYSVLVDIVKNGIVMPEIEVNTELLEKLSEEEYRSAVSGSLQSITDPQKREVAFQVRKNGVRNNIIQFRKDWDIRAEAAFALGILGDLKAREFLVKSLQSENPKIRLNSFMALIALGDVRSIKAMIEISGEDSEINQYIFSCGMNELTQVILDRSKPFLVEGKKYIKFKDFPELGEIALEDGLKKGWIRWYETGEQRTKQKFDNIRKEFEEAKVKAPQDKYVYSSYERQELSKLGVAALPLLIEQIKAGETELIPVVSRLSRNALKEDATVEEVLIWWKENEEMKTIYPKSGK